MSARHKTVEYDFGPLPELPGSLVLAKDSRRALSATRCWRETAGGGASAELLHPSSSRYAVLTCCPALLPIIVCYRFGRIDLASVQVLYHALVSKGQKGKYHTAGTRQTCCFADLMQIL